MSDARLFRPQFMQYRKDAEIIRKYTTCLICDTPLPKSCQFYCSGHCITEAKRLGVYGREEKFVQK